MFGQDGCEILASFFSCVFMEKSREPKIEQFQRQAMGWILSLKPRQMSYRKRLLALNMLSLRETEREKARLVFSVKRPFTAISMLTLVTMLPLTIIQVRCQSASCCFTVPAI